MVVLFFSFSLFPQNLFLEVNSFPSEVQCPPLVASLDYDILPPSVATKDSSIPSLLHCPFPPPSSFSTLVGVDPQLSLLMRKFFPRVPWTRVCGASPILLIKLFPFTRLRL